MLKRSLLVAALLLSAHVLLAAEKSDDEINSLIKKLGSSRWQEREDAELKLGDLGFKALSQLQEALEQDDPEINLRVRRLLNGYELLSDMKAPWPKCYHACKRAIAVADKCVETDPVKAVRLYEGAAKTYPYFLNSHDFRAAFKRALKNAPQHMREAYYKTGHGLYLASMYKEYVEKYPKGFYAPYAQYCAIAGYETYFIDWSQRNARREVVVRDPELEIKAWSEYLKTYPGFKGCDDANYRLARALEKKQMPVEACLQFRMKYPDGDMKHRALERMQFIMETRMDAQTIMKVSAMAQKERANPKLLLIDDAGLKALCSYLCAMKFYYARNFHEAAGAFEAVAQLPVGTSQFSMNVRKQAVKRAAFSAQAAALAKVETADGLYKYASHIYKEADRTFVANVVSAPAGRSSYHGTQPREFFPPRTRFWHSAQVYRQILEKYPGADVTPKTLFMLGNCYCRLGEKSDDFWRSRRKDNVRKAIVYYEKVANEHGDHNLAAAARKAAATLRKRWRVE